MAYRSRQRKHGGGKFKSERQRRFLWAVVPRAAKKWAHNRGTRKSDWVGVRRPRPTVRGAAKAATRKVERRRTTTRKATVNRSSGNAGKARVSQRTKKGKARVHRAK